jgi:signal transduction histidine kinase
MPKKRDTIASRQLSHSSELVGRDAGLVIGKLQQLVEKQNALLEHEQSVRRKTSELNAGQSKLLEMVAKGVDLKETLSSLMLLIESQSKGVICSTLLLDADGIHIRAGAAPNLPEEYSAQLDGIEIGPTVGSCGTAMYLKKQVIVTDMLSDPLWAPYKGLIEPYGYRACWSTPIFLDQHTVLGAFAMYYREVRSPVAEDMELIGIATYIAGIAIERTRRERELILHRDNLEELVAQRTSQLISANTHVEAINRSLTNANQELASALNNLNLTQEELVRRDKLAALGALVAGVAHELNTPIGNCLLAASTMAEKTELFAQVYATGIKRSQLESYIEDAVTSSDVLVRNLKRAADLVTSFKQVAVDQTSSQRRLFSVEDYFNDILFTLQPSIKRSAITVTSRIQPGLTMDSYPGPLAQVMTNLINNALLHGFEDRPSGAIVISAHEANPGWLELIVNDDGNGISAENQPRIYTPFFTTKRNVGGTGLGLHITHNIVTGLLGGRIRFQSELGVGTTFYISIPLIVN